MTFNRMLEDVMEFYNERAAIFEFEGEMPKEDAEQMAMHEVEKFYGSQWVAILRDKVRGAA